MTRVTRFATRDPGPAARMAGFMAHLRGNGLRLGVGEAELALQALTHVQAANPAQARLALRAVLTGCAEDAARFDDLFDGYWMNGGRVVTGAAPRVGANSPHVHSSRTAPDGQASAGGGGDAAAPDNGEGEAEADGEGRLIAITRQSRAKLDLRDLVTPEDVAEAEAVARRLGAALRDRRSRRRKAAKTKGDRPDFRRIMRHSLATGGEPMRILKRRRPDRPVKLVSLCDVSGSMRLYAQVYLAFVAGLMRCDPTADAYLFHTRLVRITDALRDRDAMRAMGRMSLMADGFGGGSRIGASLDLFARTYARRFVDGRTVVLILSDGYDTDPHEAIGAAMQRLKRRGCRVIWLNPLKGWRDYAPVAGGMAAALPHVDLFCPANTLADLAALEPELMRL
ncbi:vWA domain-containing protein [Pseudoprimorskyibacter insulae]|uniref:VWFA domain-containing protein n=1 Tax=Pseudoprimorskyibacter insulae TaxID=1695997 RepID=A0A2R8AQD8_9RHOB|nr:VWA domain-containing protein [Pseudoprimorskyibacter insulae]SPF78180.1 hypothetical protein PRI8871_00773 [Pseudoprimorskyibacter insulae]